MNPVQGLWVSTQKSLLCFVCFHHAEKEWTFSTSAVRRFVTTSLNFFVHEGLELHWGLEARSLRSP